MAATWFLVGTIMATAAVFGSAEADAVVVDSDTMEYALSVEAPEATSVVVHALDPGSEQVTVAMLESSPGVYRTRFESRPLDYIIVFEDLGSGVQSDPFRLSELGVAPEFVGKPPSPEAEDDPTPDSTLGWLALGLGLASLSALAFWVLGGDRKRGAHGEPAVDDQGEPTVDSDASD